MPHPLPGPSELDTLYCRGLLSRAQFLKGLAALGLSVASIERILGSGEIARAAPATPRYLVLIVMDACRADYLSLAPLPAISALRASGVSFSRAWVGHLLSDTPAGHATISTGAMPARHGILGFQWRDPATEKRILDGWEVNAIHGTIERDLAASGTTSIPHAIKNARPSTRVVALSSEKAYAADAMGGATADYILFNARGKHGVNLIPHSIPGHRPQDDFFHDPSLRRPLPLQHFTDWDDLSGALAVRAIDMLHPDVLMVNFPGPDIYGHAFGGPASPGVMGTVLRGIDRNIGQIVAAYKRAGIFHETLFVITADHGMVPNDRSVDSHQVQSAVRSTGSRIFFQDGGTARYIYLRDQRPPLAPAVEVGRVPNVVASYYQTRSSAGYEYVSAGANHLPLALQNAHHYLLATFAGGRAPDIVAPFRENTIGRVIPTRYGYHGGLDWGSHHIPLILSGPGVAVGHVSSYPARLVDVAPTVLTAFGIPPIDMDGTVLADAIVDAGAGSVAAQERDRTELTAHQDAMITQALDDIDADKKMDRHPPPPAQFKP